MDSATLSVPIERNADGVLRVGGTRVTLDTVVTAFQTGATPEEIALRYSSLELADIYAAISYYLQNQAEVDLYLEQRREFAAKVREKNESRFDPEGIRTRLLRRSAEQADRS